MIKYALYINRLIWDDWILWPTVFLSWLCWKITLDTSKIVNHLERSKRCNRCLLPCCVLSLSEGCFVIRVYTSLANYILHLWGPLIYFSSHMSGQRVFILLCGSEHAAIEIANNWRYYWKCFAKCMKLITVGNPIIALRTKTADGISWTSPSGQIWSKNTF
jgi:hypothetical protein